MILTAAMMILWKKINCHRWRGAEILCGLWNLQAGKFWLSGCWDFPCPIMPLYCHQFWTLLQKNQSNILQQQWAWNQGGSSKGACGKHCERWRMHCEWKSNSFISNINSCVKVSYLNLQCLCSGPEIYARPIVDQWAQIWPSSLRCHHKSGPSYYLPIWRWTGQVKGH